MNPIGKSLSAIESEENHQSRKKGSLPTTASAKLVFRKEIGKSRLKDIQKSMLCNKKVDVF